MEDWPGHGAKYWTKVCTCNKALLCAIKGMTDFLVPLCSDCNRVTPCISQSVGEVWTLSCFPIYTTSGER